MNSISLTGALSEFIPFFIFFGFWMNSLSLTHALSEFMNFLHIFLGFWMNSLSLTYALSEFFYVFIFPESRCGDVMLRDKWWNDSDVFK